MKTGNKTAPITAKTTLKTLSPSAAKLTNPNESNTNAEASNAIPERFNFVAVLGEISFIYL